jgi:hypothetical protein
VNVGLQIITPGVGPDTENTPVDAFSFNGYSNFVAERYDYTTQFVAVGSGETVGGYWGAAFTGSSDPVDAGIGFFTTEAQTPTHNGMALELRATPNGSTFLNRGLSVSAHGNGGVTIGDEGIHGTIADLGNGTIHAADSIATDNHIRSMGPAPSLSSCGSSGPTVNGTDIAGIVSTNGQVSSCKITFAQAYPSIPVCIVQTFAIASPVSFISAQSKTAITVNFSAPFNGGFNYICIGKS